MTLCKRVSDALSEKDSKGCLFPEAPLNRSFCSDASSKGQTYPPKQMASPSIRVQLLLKMISALNSGNSTRERHTWDQSNDTVTSPSGNPKTTKQCVSCRTYLTRRSQPLITIAILISECIPVVQALRTLSPLLAKVKSMGEPSQCCSLVSPEFCFKFSCRVATNLQNKGTVLQRPALCAFVVQKVRYRNRYLASARQPGRT